MVSRNLAFASCHVIILLGLLSFVTGEESLDTNPIDYGNSESSLNPAITKKCPDYTDPLLCQYWRYLQESGKARLLNPFGRDHGSTITTNETDNLKEDGHQQLLLNIPIGTFDKTMEKRFKVFRRQNFFPQGYKRGPGFRSWGGKRDPIYASPDLQKRSKFGAWGGKRDFESWEDSGTGSWETESNDKRTRFTNWGGKRNDYDEPTDKRSKFQSWGGRKRGEDDFQDGGKGDIENEMAYDRAQKRDFNRNFRNLFLREPFKKHSPKRPQFQSWGGKRTTPSPWNNLLPFYFHPYQPDEFDTVNPWIDAVKRKFSSWGGKRSDDDEITDDYTSSDYNDEGRNSFQMPSHLINGNLVTRVKRGNGNTDFSTYAKPPSG